MAGVAAAVLCVAAFLAIAAAASDNAGPMVILGPDVPHGLAETARRLLEPFDATKGGGPEFVIALGDAPETRHLISAEELEARSSPEAFAVRSGNDVTGRKVLAATGRSRRALGFAFFELLQNLGFGFLHPLKPVVPDTLPDLSGLEKIDIVEEPRWEFRGTHYHTQHPLELTNLLNGFDADMSNEDRASWLETFSEWEAFLDWMLAQKQNYVEWMLLADHKATTKPGTSFELSDERQERMKLLVQAAHDRGLEVGVDVPLTLQQQHALNLLPSPSGKWETDFAEITRRVQWVLDCGFDHLGTELGSTEFTRGLSAKTMVQILNSVQDLIGPNRRIFVKNHCSTGQLAEGYPDPRGDHKDEELNFNYLSYYADPRIVSMPHTVQIYSLRDPAPTYGNQNFSDLRDWARFLMQEGRPMVLYPETGYWVNYDTNVPLFLAPIYAKTRLDDALDVDSMSDKRPPMGQMNFESGWQWGYWLANAAQATVAWRREHDTNSLFHRLLRFIEPSARGPLVELLEAFAYEQKRLLIDGIVGSPPAPGVGPGSVTGMAYLQGSEGLSDLGNAVARRVGGGPPAPDRLQFRDLWDFWPSTFGRVAGLMRRRGLAARRRQWYFEHLQPMLRDMNTTFALLAKRFAQLPPVAPAAQESVKDLAVTAELLSLRCAQVLALYDHAASCGSLRGTSSSKWCEARIADSRAALQAALTLVPEREAHYGLAGGAESSSRISGWRSPNPTSYAFGYLWAAHKLFYWQRDQAIVERRIWNPCFSNIQDPVELGLPGGGRRITHRVRDAIRTLLYNRVWPKAWRVGLTECLFVRETEPEPWQGITQGSSTS